MRRRLRIAAGMIVLALGLLFWSVPSHATTLALTNWNVTNLTGDQVLVTYGGTTVTLQWSDGGSGLTAKTIDKFYYNSSATPTSVFSGITDVTSAWGSGNTVADGFGSFTKAWTTPDGIGAGTTNLLTFTFASAPTFSPIDFAAHVAYGNNCSGYVSNKTPNSTSPDAACTPIPEPGTLALVGSGLVGMGAAIRKRFLGWNRKDLA